MAARSWMDRSPFAPELVEAQFYDVARFGAADTAAQVAAALSCIGCLGSAADVVVGLIGQLPVAVCRCGVCDASTALELDAYQARRLLVDGHVTR